MDEVQQVKDSCAWVMWQWAWFFNFLTEEEMCFFTDLPQGHFYRASHCNVRVHYTLLAEKRFEGQIWEARLCRTFSQVGPETDSGNLRRTSSRGRWRTKQNTDVSAMIRFSDSVLLPKTLLSPILLPTPYTHSPLPLSPPQPSPPPSINKFTCILLLYTGQDQQITPSFNIKFLNCSNLFIRTKSLFTVYFFLWYLPFILKR